MPSIRSSSNGGVIRWDKDDWMRGLLPFSDINNYESYVGGTGIVSSTGIDPFRRPGYVMPGVEPDNATNVSVIDGVAKNGAVFGSSAYIGAGGKIHQFNVTTQTLTNSGGTFPYSIDHGHASETIEDVVIAYDGATPYLFYSFNDGTDGDVGRYDFSTTFDDNYMSTVPTNGAVLDKDFPHPMIVGDDGILYIGDGNNLASLNFTTSTYNPSALDLPPGFVMSTFATTPSFLVIFAYRNGSSSGSSYYRSETKAFFWDYRSVSFSYVYDLPGNVVNGGFNFKSTVGCFVQGDSAFLNGAKTSKMVLFNGSNFEPIVNFSNNIPIHGGVEVSDNVIFWNSDGHIYQYGSPHIGMESAFNRITKGGGSTSGMLRNFASNRLVCSSGTTTSGGLQAMYRNYYDGDLWTPIVEIPTDEYSKVRVTKVKIGWLSEGADTNGKYRCNVFFRFNSGSYQQTIVGSGDDVPFSETADDDTFALTYYNANDGTPFYRANSLGLRVQYELSDNTELPAIVRFVDVHYEYIKV